MNRREFMRSGAAAALAGASTPLAGTSLEQPPAPPAGAVKADECIPGPYNPEKKTGVDFDVTGLFAFQATQNDQMRWLLLDGKKAKLKDAHAPFLMMPFEAYIPPNVTNAEEAYQQPNIIRLGPRAMAIWSLIGANVWVYDAHTTFDGPDGEGKVLTYDDTPIKCDPEPLCEDKGWASLRWFPRLSHLLNDGSAATTGGGSLTCKDKMVTSYVRLTRGYAAGRAPATDCERRRKYMLDNLSSTARTYATQMHVLYEHDKPVLRLAIAPKQFCNEEAFVKVVHVRMTEKTLVPITIVNTPQTHVDHRHYKAFYELVGKDGRDVTHNPPCIVGGLEARVHKEIGGHVGPQPAAPDPDCIPPGIP
jgi:hypothetical protein